MITMATCGFLSAVIALLFDIEKLVEFMSIGTLMAYTIVSAAVIILRYRPLVKTESIPLAETSPESVRDLTDVISQTYTSNQRDNNFFFFFD